MFKIIANEWTILLRSKVLTYLTILFTIGLSLVTYLSIQQNKAQLAQQKAAQAHIREQWESIDAMNPHSAAHFGTYAFKPINALSSLDEGVNAITGNVLRLEGHVQNEIVYSEASQSLSISKFGKLKPSLLLQYIIPLVLIFLAFTSVSSEKESGRLKLLVFQGAPLSKIILSKALSIWLYGLGLLTLTITCQTVINWNSASSDGFERMLFIYLVYAAYYYIIASLSVFFSAKLKNSTAALSSMLSVWILWTIFLPKLWGNTIDKLHPLPSRQSFKNAMQEDRAKGIDGHNPSDQREKALKEKVLAKYKVDSIEQLPINFDGIVMQADEEYGNQVWDKHFGNNYQILQRQKSWYQYAGLINPYAALQSASMGYSGSDMLHHLDFLKKAELYRRVLIKTLNDKHAYGGSKSGDWNWKANNAFFKSIKDFEYTALSVQKATAFYMTDLFSLGCWIALSTFIVLFNAKKIKLV